jgi:hypothetical protein
MPDQRKAPHLIDLEVTELDFEPTRLPPMVAKDYDRFRRSTARYLADYFFRDHYDEKIEGYIG